MSTSWEDYYRGRIVEINAEIDKERDLLDRIGKARSDISFRIFCMKSKSAAAKHQATADLLAEAFTSVYHLIDAKRAEVIALEEKLKRHVSMLEA